MKISTLLSSFALCSLPALLPAQSVVGVWRFDETTGVTAADSGPFANDGTLINGLATPWVPGQLGNALSFRGVDDYVDVAFNGGLPFHTGLGEAFTITFWVKGLATDDDRFFSLSNTASGTPLLTFGTGRSSLTNESKLQVFRRHDDNNTRPERYSVGDVFDDTWHHVTYVEHSSWAQIYIDGAADSGFAIDSGRLLSNDVITIGAIRRPSNSPPVCCHFDGELDDLHVYDYALNAADIASVMTGAIAMTPRASLATYGSGCTAPGSFGPMTLQAFGDPQLGGSLSYSVTGGIANGSALLMIGAGIPQIFDLSGFGAEPGCTFFAPFSGALLGMPPMSAAGATTGPVTLPVPMSAALAGANVTAQALIIAPFFTSNASVAVLGN